MLGIIGFILGIIGMGGTAGKLPASRRVIAPYSYQSTVNALLHRRIVQTTDSPQKRACYGVTKI